MVVDAEAAANGGIGPRLPGKSQARKKRTKYICLQGFPAIGVRRGKPQSAQTTRGVGNRRVKEHLVAVNFIPSMADIVAEPDIDGEVGAHLVIVLNEHLRVLHARSVLRRDGGVPVVRETEQEVGITEAGGPAAGSCACIPTRRACRAIGARNGPLRRVPTVETHASGVDVTPICVVLTEEQKLSAKMKDVLAADHRHDIRRIEVTLFVVRVACRADPRIVRETADAGKLVGLAKLPADHRGIAFIQGGIGVVGDGPGVTHSGFIDHGRANIPHIRNLIGIFIRKSELATQRAGREVAEVGSRICLHPHGIRDPVVRRDVIIQTASVRSKRVGIRQACVPVVLKHAGGRVYSSRLDCSEGWVARSSRIVGLDGVSHRIDHAGGYRVHVRAGFAVFRCKRLSHRIGVAQRIVGNGLSRWVVKRSRNR